MNIKEIFICSHVKMFLLVFFLCLSRYSLGQNVLTPDDVIDDFLKTVRDQINYGQLDTFKIDDLTWHFKHLSKGGVVKCENGSVKSLGSLRKSGKVAITKQHKITILNIPLEFGNLQYNYENCKYKFLRNLYRQGGLSARAVSNSLQVQATITNDGGECEALITSIKFVDIGKVNLTMEGKAGRTCERQLVTSALLYMKNVLAPLIIEKLQIVVPIVISNEYLCNNIDSSL